MDLLHPGVILNETVLKARNISQKSFAKQIGMSIKCMSAILKGELGITEKTDFKLCRYLYTERGFWSNLYKEYKLTKRRFKKHEKSKGIEGISV